jgi:hypothetical protein
LISADSEDGFEREIPGFSFINIPLLSNTVLSGVNAMGVALNCFFLVFPGLEK